MNHIAFSGLTASICYHGQKTVIAPGTHAFEKGLQAELEYRKIDNCTEWVMLRLKNTGTENTHQITLPKTIDLDIHTTELPCYHGLRGDSCGETTFLPVDFPVVTPFHEEPLGGRSSSESGFPFFDLTFGSRTMVFAIGWTGQWSKDIILFSDGFTVQIGLCDVDFYLRPGEEVRLPSVLIVQGENVQETRRKFRRVLRNHFSPRERLLPKSGLPISIQCFDRYFQGLEDAKTSDAWATEAGQLKTLAKAKKLEYINTLWLDAAWFDQGFPCGVGNYRFSAGFPNGLRPVSDGVHDAGMKFVLWFEPERVYEGSDLFPQEKMLLTSRSDPKTRLFNLADPTALQWLENKLISMIHENRIDVYRQDCNLDLLPFWRENDEPQRKGITEIKYITGIYHLWDTLLAAFPALLIDNCASGGRRLDLETMSRAVSLWRSDTGCFPENQNKRVTVWSQNQILTLSEYLPYHACAVWEPDAYTVRSAATQGLACNFDIFSNDFDFRQGQAILQEVQELSPYWDGDFYPLTVPTTDEHVWIAYQLSLGAKGIVYTFRREKCETATICLPLKAIDTVKNYSVTLIDEHLCRTTQLHSGSALKDGIQLTIPEARGSLILKYEQL